MKLTDLNPEFFDAGGPGIRRLDGSPVEHRRGVGMIFDCPCGQCGVRAAVEFDVAADGRPWKADAPRWKRTGDDFGSMTLSPSILRSKDKGGCGWHGWIRNGEVINA